MTNADKIRQMTDKEMSEWLLYKARVSCTILFDGKCRTGTYHTCEKCVEAWLKQVDTEDIITNADKIRQMTEKELSEWLLYKARANCTKLFEKWSIGTHHTFEKYVEEWLKQGVKENA